MCLQSRAWWLQRPWGCAPNPFFALFCRRSRQKRAKRTFSRTPNGHPGPRHPRPGQRCNRHESSGRCRFMHRMLCAGAITSHFRVPPGVGGGRRCSVSARACRHGSGIMRATHFPIHTCISLRTGISGASRLRVFVAPHGRLFTPGAPAAAGHSAPPGSYFPHDQPRPLAVAPQLSGSALPGLLLRSAQK